MAEIKEVKVLTGLTTPEAPEICINDQINQLLSEGWDLPEPPKTGSVRYKPGKSPEDAPIMQTYVSATLVKYTTHEDQMEAAQKYADEILARRKETGRKY